MNEKIFKAIFISLMSMGTLFSTANMALASVFSLASFLFLKETGADYFSISVIVFFACLIVGEFLSFFAFRKVGNFTRAPAHILLTILRAIWIIFLTVLLIQLTDDGAPKGPVVLFRILACCALVYNGLLLVLHFSFSFRQVREKFLQAQRCFEDIDRAKTPV